jgi:UTP-glucose-1-phosphate uridylyltransferase
MKGFGDAVLCAKSVVGTKDPILVMLGDHVYTSSAANKVPCAKQLVDAWVAHGSSGSATSLDTCDIHHVHVNGLVVCEPLGGSAHSTNVLRITSGAEKPLAAWVQANLKPSGKGASGEDVYTCYFGMDLLSPLIFEELESMDERTHGELQLRDAMMRVAARERMLGVQMEGKRHDTGLPYEYAASMAAMAAEE